MNSPSIEMMREETRNQILRRVDWRFLLSDPHPAKSVCFAGERLAQAVAAISGQLVTAPQVMNGQCDLTVALNPDRATLQQAWLALHPGGECYIEWYWPLIGGTRRISRRLQALGFEDVHCYWPWPWPQRTPAFWLPLDAPGLVTYFLQQRAQIGGFKRRILFKLREAAWHLTRRAGMLRPICVTARKPGANDRSPDLRAHWPEWGLGGSSEQLYTLLLTGGQHSLNKVVALQSSKPRGAPPLIVKRPRVPEANEGLRREAAVLQQIQRRYPQLSGIPRLVFSGETAAGFSLGETVLNGVPLYTRLRRATFGTLAQQATTWLIGLAGASGPQHSAAPACEKLFAGLHDVYGTDLPETRWQQTRALLAPLGTLPIVCEQRDFSPWNVLIDEHDQWNVLDWEAAELDGLPARDLVYFLTYLSFFVEGVMPSGQYRAAYRRLLDRTSFTGAVFAECQARYAQAVGFDPSWLKALRVLTWMMHTRAEYQRHGAGFKTRAGRSSLFISFWEEELEEQSIGG